MSNSTVFWKRWLLNHIHNKFLRLTGMFIWLRWSRVTSVELWRFNSNFQMGVSLIAQLVKNLGSGVNPWVGKIPWRRKWQPTPVFVPGESHGQRSLVGYSPRGRKESDTTERLHSHFHSYHYHLLHESSLNSTWHLTTQYVVSEWSRSVVSDSLRPHGL